MNSGISFKLFVTEYAFSRAESNTLTIFFNVCVCLCHRDAVGSVGGVHCSFNVTQQLKSLAVSAFGNPNNWNEAQVSELGNIVG